MLNWSIEFSPVIPIWLLISAGGIMFVLSGMGLIGRQQGLLFRILAYAAFLLALLNPAIEREDREPLTSVVALVVDGSQSQELDGRNAVTESAREILTEQLNGFEDFEVRIVEAGRGTQYEQKDGTELFSDLEAELSDVSPDRVAGAIIITDGQVHDVPQNVASLGFQAPVHAFITGKSDEIDRRLVLERAPKFGLVGTQQIVNLRLVDKYSDDSAQSGNARIVVRRDGNEVSTISVRPGVAYSVPVEIDHGGDNIFEFEVEELPNELTQLNNRIVVTIEGIRENLRVLLVSGEPHPGERTWRNLLKSDASVDLVHFTILRPPEKQDGTPINELSLIAFPTRELFNDKIQQFDLIILDRYQQRGVLPVQYFNNIAQYVQAGGALLLASGAEYSNNTSLYLTPLAAVLPAEPNGNVYIEPYWAKVSELGNRHPVTRSLPGADSEEPDWSQWFTMVDANQRHGDAIMKGPDDKPLLILNRQGEGRVALMLSDHAWLWARGFDGGGPHVPLLRNLSHWLMKEPDLAEEALKLKATGNELTIERQTLGESVDPVILTNPTGQSQRITLEQTSPGLWQAVLPVNDLGLYTVSDGERTTLANVGPQNPKEFSDVTSTTEVLSAIASSTNGTISRISESGSRLIMPRVVPVKSTTTFSGSGWIGLKATSASVLKGVDRIPLLFGFLGLAILLGSLTLTWYREGR